MEHDHDTTQRPAATKRLLRDPQRGPLGGVCAGIGRYFDVDPTVIRIATVILALMGPGIPAYLIAWAFVPADDGRTLIASASPVAARHDRGTQVFGITLLVIAGSVLWGDWWSPARHWLIPLGCIALGSWLLFRKDDESGEPVMPPPPPPGAGPTTTRPHPWAGPAAALPVAAPITESIPDTADGTEDPTEPLDAAADADGTEPPGPPTAYGWSGDLGDESAAVAVPRRRRVVGPVVFGALLLWAGIAFGFGVALDTGLAVALCIVGVGFVLGAFMGGAWGLVVPALLLAGAMVVSSVVDIPLRGGIGDRTWRVADLDDVRDSYELAIGEATLDLRDIVVPAGREVEIDVHQGIGHLVVLVPSDTTVEVQAEVGMGDAMVFDQSDDGPGIDIDRTITGSADRGTLDLDLELGIGQIEVRQVAPTLVRPETPSTTSTTAVLG